MFRRWVAIARSAPEVTLLISRTRCSIVVRNSRGNLLVDTPPDLRTQLLREKIGVVHEVLFTHEHADHLFGLDDLRLFPFHLGHPVPLHCEPRVEKRIRHSFDYAFSEKPATHPGATPKLEFRSIEPNCSFTVNDIQVLPIRLKHGPRFDVLGFRFGEFAYCTDVNEIPEASLPLLENLKVLVLGIPSLSPPSDTLSFGSSVGNDSETEAKKSLSHAPFS